MPRTPKPAPVHPVDVRRAEVLAAPAGFTATIRANGRGNTLTCPTLEAAAMAAASLEEGAALVYGATARANVYALPADGGRGEVIEPRTWRALVPETARAALRRGITANLAKGGCATA